jgi:hypothetical protein
VAALVGSLGVIGGVLAGVAGGCTSSDCTGGCDGGTVYPAWSEDEPVGDVETVEWKFEFDGDHYEITCTTGPEYPAPIPLGHGDQISCEGSWVHIGRDIGPMRVQARELGGRWSTDGWYEVVPDGGPDCGCTVFEVFVPIVYHHEDA